MSVKQRKLDPALEVSMFKPENMPKNDALTGCHIGVRAGCIERLTRQRTGSGIGGHELHGRSGAGEGRLCWQWRLPVEIFVAFNAAVPNTALCWHGCR